MQHSLQDHFSGNRFIKSISPGEAVAYGAAWLASSMANKESVMVLEVELLPVNLAAPGGVIITLLKCSIKVPPNNIVIITNYGNQSMMYEGRHAVMNDKKHSGYPTLTWTPSDGNNLCHLRDNVLIVSAVEKLSKKQVTLHAEDTVAASMNRSRR